MDRQPCRKLYKLAAEIKIKPSSKMNGDPTQDEPPGGGRLLFSKSPILDGPHFPFMMSAWLQHRQSLNQTKTNGLIHLVLVLMTVLPRFSFLRMLIWRFHHFNSTVILILMKLQFSVF